MSAIFIWGSKPAGELAMIEDSIRNEVGNFKVRFQDFPDDLIFRLSVGTPPLAVEGVATSMAGKTLVTISYSLQDGHRGDYLYVGGSPEIQKPR